MATAKRTSRCSVRRPDIGTSSSRATGWSARSSGARTAIFRWLPMWTASGEWFVAKSMGGAITTTWGGATDIPVGGDFDGDGKTDFTVWRPTAGTWYSQYTAGTGFGIVGWGMNGDQPSGRRPGS